MNQEQYQKLLNQGWRPGQIIHYKENTENRPKFSMHVWPQMTDEAGVVPPWIYIAHEMAHNKLRHFRNANWLNRALYDMMVKQEEEAWALVLADAVYKKIYSGHSEDLDELLPHAMAALSTYYEGLGMERRIKAQNFVYMVINGTEEYIRKRRV